jgi:hypothetical protein
MFNKIWEKIKWFFGNEVTVPVKPEPVKEVKAKAKKSRKKKAV